VEAVQQPSNLGALPAPTRNLSQAHRDLDEFGYCLVSDALDPRELRRLRRRLVEQAKAEKVGGVAFIDGEGANQRVFNLVNKGSEFLDLLTHLVVSEFLSPLLGEAFLLSSLTANIAGPGGRPMVLHQDQGYIPYPQPEYPLVANIGWFLDDVTEANGGTRLVPGSHRLNVPLKQPWSATTAAAGPAGTAFVFDGRLWHGTGANQTAQRRHVILSYFCRPFLRQQENPFLSLVDEVERSLSQPVRALLGFQPWHGLGGVEGPRVIDEDGFVSRPHHPLKRMPNSDGATS
jgi:ectoine hydroxylase-related dioxygenase (phytanoyl-CoA dioxygenase family)